MKIWSRCPRWSWTRCTRPIAAYPARSSTSASTAGHRFTRATSASRLTTRSTSLSSSTPANADILKRLPASLAHLPPDWLGSNDSMAIYALNCSLVRTLHDVRSTPTLLQSGVHDALTSPLLQPPGAAKTRCAASLRLWDSLAAVIGQLGQRPGRRAVLVLTDGHDQGSRQTWNQLQLFADRFSVALIALRPASVHLSRDAAGWTGIDPAGGTGDHTQKSFEEILGMLCGQTGGLVLDVDPSTLVPQLERAVSLLRNRYILEFPRAANGTNGLHEITVTVADPNATVRTTGISFPLQDKVLLNAPGTLPNNPGRAPEQGTRKILTQPQ